MFTDTVTFPEPWPDAGDADSQLPPLAVETLTVQVVGTAFTGGAVTCVTWLGGFEPPACPVKFSVAGNTLIDVAAICSVTLAVAVPPPPAVTVTVPL